MSKEEFYEHVYSERTGCGGPLYLAGILLLVLIVFSGCASKKSVETTEELRSHAELSQKMDSLIRSTATFQRDLFQRQTSLVDSVRQSERRDSSHTVTLNEKGDTIRERIVIYREIEREHSTEKEEKEFWQQMLQQRDSLLQVITEKQEKTDSLLRDHQKEVVVEKKPGLVDRLMVKVGWVAVIGMIFFIIVWLIYSKLRR